MSLPLFPHLTPRIVESAWFNVDQPCDDENEVAELEHEHQAWLNTIAQKNMDLIPIGKDIAIENIEEDEEEDDEDDNDDDESETHDEEDEDEIEMDESQERNSPVDVSIPMVQGHGVR